MIKANVYVKLRKNIPDAQGKTVMNALHTTGYETVESLTIGKFIEITFDETDLEIAKSKLEVICKDILSNPNIETYRYELTQL